MESDESRVDYRAKTLTSDTFRYTIYFLKNDRTLKRNNSHNAIVTIWKLLLWRMNGLKLSRQVALYFMLRSSTECLSSSFKSQRLITAES